MFGWLRTVFFKGLIVLIPLVLLWLAIRELVEMLVGILSGNPETQTPLLFEPELIIRQSSDFIYPGQSGE